MAKKAKKKAKKAKKSGLITSIVVLVMAIAVMAIMAAPLIKANDDTENDYTISCYDYVSNMNEVVTGEKTAIDVAKDAKETALNLVKDAESVLDNLKESLGLDDDNTLVKEAKEKLTDAKIALHTKTYPITIYDTILATLGCACVAAVLALIGLILSIMKKGRIVAILSLVVMLVTTITAIALLASAQGLINSFGETVASNFTALAPILAVVASGLGTIVGSVTALLKK